MNRSFSDFRGIFYFFHRDILSESLVSDKPGTVHIKQGLERSGYKPQGKAPNQAKHKRIKELLALGSMTKEEIAKAVGCGIATVYRVAKSN